MTGYEIKPENVSDGVKEEILLVPINPDDRTGNDREKEFLMEIVKRINNLFGDIAPLVDQKHFAVQIAQKTQENDLVNEQINQNTKAHAMTGDLPKNRNAISHSGNGFA
jgi:type I restriction enzyme R subunit